MKKYILIIPLLISALYKKLKTANLHYLDKGLHSMHDDKDWYFDQLNNFIKS